MNELEFFKDLYDIEYQRKQELTSNVSTPLTVLTLIGGLLAYHVQSFRLSDLDSPTNEMLAIVTSLLLSIAGYYFFRAAYSLSRAFRFRFTNTSGYHALSHAEELLEYQSGL